MNLGIEASNIRSGGGLTHLREFLQAVDNADLPFGRVLLWASGRTLDRIAERPWLEKRHHALLDGSYAAQALWRQTVFPRELKQGCDILFVPGGIYLGSFRPFVTMSQNLLPFDPAESRRFGWSSIRLRYLILRMLQSRTFRNADGVIFLTRGAQQAVERLTGPLRAKTAIIPHGITEAMCHSPRAQQDISAYTFERPFRWLYVSIVNWYKHQWTVVEAVGRLRREGLPVALDLIGPAPVAEPMQKLRDAMERVDPGGEFIRYLGNAAHDALPGHLHGADGYVFASSCENLPIILLEGMAAGLPIACSGKQPMPEVLDDAGVYFDAEDPASIADALGRVTTDRDLRTSLSEAAFARAGGYTWDRHVRDTLGFLKDIACTHNTTARG